jgi:hypothetical protein
MKSILKITFTIIIVFMTYIIISTSLKSNLFKEWDYLTSIPWMKATLWDFYANVFVIYLWIFYKQTSNLSKLIWLLLLVFLGSVGTLLYLLTQLVKLKKHEGIKELLLKQN